MSNGWGTRARSALPTWRYTAADALFAAMHMVSLGGNTHDLDITFEIEETGARALNDYFEGTDYRVRLLREEETHGAD